MRLKLYDIFILFGFTSLATYTMWLWIIASANDKFNLFGALFMIIMGYIFLKAFILFSGIFIDWVKPKFIKQFGKFKLNYTSISLFNKRIEISIKVIDKSRSKVTF